jgi:hypothetical protein
MGRLTREAADMVTFVPMQLVSALSNYGGDAIVQCESGEGTVDRARLDKYLINGCRDYPSQISDD